MNISVSNINKKCGHLEDLSEKYVVALGFALIVQSIDERLTMNYLSEPGKMCCKNTDLELQVQASQNAAQKLHKCIKFCSREKLC